MHSVLNAISSLESCFIPRCLKVESSKCVVLLQSYWNGKLEQQANTTKSTLKGVKSKSVCFIERLHNSLSIIIDI
jgi:hypothetical protein